MLFLTKFCAHNCRFLQLFKGRRADRSSKATVEDLPRYLTNVHNLVPCPIKWYKTMEKGLTATKKQGLIRSSLILMSAVLVGKIAGLIFKIALANLLGGTGMGYFSSAYAVFTPLYALCAVSLTPAVAQLVSENDARGDRAKLKGVKTAALRIFTLPSIICSTAPMLFAGFITRRFLGNEGAKLAVIAILPCVFLGTVTAIYRGYYEGLRNMTPTALSQILESVVRVGGGIGLAFWAQKHAYSCFIAQKEVFGVRCMSQAQLGEVSLPYVAAAAVLGVTLSEVSSFLFMILRHVLRGDGIDKKIKPSPSDIKCEKKRLMALIMPISAAAIVSSLAGTVDLYTIVLCIKSSLAKFPEQYTEKYADVIASGVALRELPNYLYGSFTGLAATVFGLAPSLCSVFGKSALPTIAEAWARGGGERVSREIRRVLTLILYIAIPAGLGLAALSHEILSLLFSSRAEEVAISAQPLAILALGTAAVSAGGAAFSMLQAVGRAELPIKITLFGAFLKLGLNTVLVSRPQLGISGAALASLISGCAMSVWAVAALYRITKTTPRLVFSIAIPTALGLIVSIFGRKSLQICSGWLNFPISVGFAVVISVISYIILILWLDISTKNRLSCEIMGKNP